MKNLLLFILCIVSVSSFAQGFGESNPKKENKPKTEKLILTEGDYLMKASKSFSAVALTTAIGLGTIYVGNKMDDPQAFITAGSIIAGSGLFFYLRGCSFLHLAGKKLNANEIEPQLGLTTTQNGLTLAFKF